ncbi:hypothetical protein HY213_01645 [Candidatus Peregrinibacteria bacterium]|nr:hypothetical protein [Candidatus Peregrinibacteria bacterium]
MTSIIAPPAAHAATPLYQRMLGITRQEMMLKENGEAGAEMLIKKFAAAILSAPKFLILRKEVDTALQQKYDALCIERPYRKGLSYGQCLATLAGTITSVASREERTRTLGRDLQIIASGFEAPMESDQPPRNLLTHAHSIISIWQTGTGGILQSPTGPPGLLAVGTGTVMTGAQIRIVNLPLSDTAMRKFQALRTQLDLLVHTNDAGERNEEELVAVVWRYHHGYRFLRGERPEFPPPPQADPESDIGTERQYLFSWSEEVEKALADIHALSMSIVVTPPLQRGEVAIIRIPPELQALLPDNILLWSNVERLPRDVISGDTGLEWDLPLEPMLPSLCRKTTVEDPTEMANNCDVGNPLPGGVTTLGGSYPPPPVDGTGLCTHPFQRSGYLCRPQAPPAGTTCVQQQKPRDGVITLSRCSAPGVIRETLAGPDACMDAPWTTSTRPFDPQTQCKVTINCIDADFSGGETFLKKPDGNIAVTVTKDPPAPLTYVFLHELTHARQICDLPPGTAIDPPKIDPKDSPAAKQAKTDQCCRVEGEAYRTQCEAMESDGVFRPPTGSKELLSISTLVPIPINVETCWQASTDLTCRTRGAGACPTAFSFSAKQEILVPFVKEINQLALNRKPRDMPLDCENTLNPPQGKQRDPRIDAALREANAIGRKVCDPNVITTYRNTIGNNLCYFDQCLEQSMETHRIAGGRATFTAGDPAFPQEACEPKVPQSMIFWGTRDPPPLPPYRPSLLLKEVDEALCQSNGLPADSPPSACGFAASRRLLLPEQLLQTGLSLLSQPQEQTSPVLGVQTMSDALGARIATSLYGRYLQGLSTSLTQITMQATMMLNRFTTVSFSPTMCSLNDAKGELLSTKFCAPAFLPPRP